MRDGVGLRGQDARGRELTGREQQRADGQRRPGQLRQVTELLPDEVPVQAPAHWPVYFAVNDCGAAERRAAELGDEILRSTARFGRGRFAVLADPCGSDLPR